MIVRKIKARYSSRVALDEAVCRSKLRLKFGSLVFLLAFALVAARLVELTAFPNGLRERAAENAHKETQKKSRIEITDRNGQVIATNLKTLSLYVNPSKVRDAKSLAKKISALFPDIDEKSAFGKVNGSNQFVWIRRNLTPEQAKSVNMIGDPALGFLDYETRVYPYGNLFSHALGFVDIDNNGISGMEKTCDGIMAKGGKTPDKMALSLDVRVQGVIREEMKKAMSQFAAIGAVGMAVDVNTGEVLSMVSLPDFNPNNPGSSSSNSRFNRAGLGVYEMGSTFKAITTAMALDSGKVSIGGGFDATDPIKFAGFTITDYHAKKRWLTVPEIFMYSSNIGTAKMALEVGGKEQKEFLKKMGMLDAINLGIPERGRPLIPNAWNELTTMTVSFGHGIAITPTHLAQSVSSLVNGGVVMPLTLFKDGNEGNEGERIIKTQTSKIMRKLLRLVVEKGTGTKGDAEGYFVGGKTGTAEKVEGGRYNKSALISSFVSVFPVNDPKYLVLVVLDEPKGNKETFGYATAGWTAAPTASRIIERIAPMLGVMPVATAINQKEAHTISDFTGDLKLASY